MNKTLTALYDSFICGFRLAWRLASELNSYPESGRPASQARPSGTPVVRRRSDGNSRTRGVNTSLALAAPCWPLCGRCGTLLEMRRAP